MEDTKVYVALIKAEDKVYLMMTYPDVNEKKSTIHGFKSQKEGLRYFEDSYDRNHNRSYESSMSAAINYMFFQPSIVSFDSTEELINKLLDENKDLVEISNVSGRMLLLTTDQKKSVQIFDSGSKPQLITKETFKDNKEKPNHA